MPDQDSKPSPAPEDKDPRPEAAPASELSEEEQMARFEEELKNEDWGHQPC